MESWNTYLSNYCRKLISVVHSIIWFSWYFLTSPKKIDNIVKYFLWSNSCVAKYGVLKVSLSKEFCLKSFESIILGPRRRLAAPSPENELKFCAAFVNWLIKFFHVWNIIKYVFLMIFWKLNYQPFHGLVTEM